MASEDQHPQSNAQPHIPPTPPTNADKQSYRTLLIGLSGPSSSGKTTLARLLSQIFNIPASPSTQNRSITLFILHEDDFYKTDALVPYTTTPPTCPSGLGSRTLQDWDCVGSLDLPLFRHTLSHVKLHGTLPPDSHSKEDQNSVGPIPLDAALVPALQAAAHAWLASLPTTALAPDTQLRICLLDGFLLYASPASSSSSSPPTPPEATAATATANDDDDTAAQRALLRAITNSLLDLKLLVLCSRSATIARRTRRTGYVTLEGFWADPPGYVEDVVWPNYVAEHAWLMMMQKDMGKEKTGGVDGDGDGMLDVDEKVVEREGLRVAPGKGEAGLGTLLEWAVGEVQRRVEAGG